MFTHFYPFQLGTMDVICVDEVVPQDYQLLLHLPTRVGFLPGRKVFPPFRWEEMGFYWEENLSSGKKLPRVTESVTIMN